MSAKWKFTKGISVSIFRFFCMYSWQGWVWVSVLTPFHQFIGGRPRALGDDVGDADPLRALGEPHPALLPQLD